MKRSVSIFTYGFIVLLTVTTAFATPKPCKGDCQLKSRTDANPAGITWVSIPKGHFTMGSNEGKWWEKPAHKVELSAFWIARSETTVAQYRACVMAGVCPTLPLKGKHDTPCTWGRPDIDTFPVTCVTHADARAFCRWSGGQLPTEAQWEYAAKSATADLPFPWGRELATCRQSVVRTASQTMGCGVATYFYRTWPVCSKPAGHSRQGVCDLIGNVFEWTADRFSSRYYQRSPKKDPPGPKPSEITYRGDYFTVRGGSYVDQEKTVFTYRRFRDPAGQRKANVGFRCVRNSAPAPSVRKP